MHVGGVRLMRYLSKMVGWLLYIVTSTLKELFLKQSSDWFRLLQEL